MPAINPITPSDGRDGFWFTLNPNLLNLYGMKFQNNFAHRVLKSVASFSGSLSGTQALSSLVTVPQTARFILIQPHVNSILVQFNSSSSFGLNLGSEKIFNFPANKSELDKIYLTAATATNITIEIFTYEI